MPFRKIRRAVTSVINRRKGRRAGVRAVKTVKKKTGAFGRAARRMGARPTTGSKLARSQPMFKRRMMNQPARNLGVSAKGVRRINRRLRRRR